VRHNGSSKGHDALLADALQQSVSSNVKTKSTRAPARSRRTKIPHSKTVCVYCGSGKGTDARYAAAAQDLGACIAEAGIGLVYGGGGLGLMGEVAKATLKAGGHVTGIIPEFLTAREHMLTDVDELIVTDDMHQRKQLMFEKSDGFVALPGGIGTLEELVEQLTWSQLGRHQKPIVVANIEGFWNPLLDLLSHMRSQAFIRPDLEIRCRVVESIADVVPMLEDVWAAVEPPADATARVAKL
jgi:uncharacterized protein (TIGR00730 family)